MDYSVPPAISYVELRPIYDMGDHCVISSFADAENFGVYVSLVGEPSSRDEVFDGPDEALEYMLRDPKFAGIKKWHNGNETMLEVHK